jgi:hypothetical protein
MQNTRTLHLFFTSCLEVKLHILVFMIYLFIFKLFLLISHTHVLFDIQIKNFIMLKNISIT